MLGYGQTDKLEEPEEYSLKKLSDDLAALLDHIASPKAVLIGHDWGSVIAARFVLWHPQRTLGVAHLSVAFFPPNKEYISLEKLVEMVPDFAYQLLLADVAAAKRIENHIEAFYKSLFAVPGTPAGFIDGLISVLNGGVQVDPSIIKAMLDDEELKYYMTQNASFRGSLNYYRTARIRFDEEKAGGLPMTYAVKIPVLFLRGTADRTSPEARIASMKQLLPQTKVINYEGAGHWIMYQEKEKVVKDVLVWLSDPGLAKL